MVVLQLPRRRRRWVASTGRGVAAIAIADLGLYALLLVGQGNPAGSRVFFIAGFLVLLAVLGIAGALARRVVARTAIYGFTAGGGLGLGLLGIDSIGLPLFGVCALSIVALSRVADRSWGPIITGTAAAFVVLMVGISTTS
jgi:hypothetical protein